MADMKLLKQRSFHKRETSTDDICVGGKIKKKKKQDVGRLGWPKCWKIKNESKYLYRRTVTNSAQRNIKHWHIINAKAAKLKV